jgi:hypothetical protein
MDCHAMKKLDCFFKYEILQASATGAAPANSPAQKVGDFC